VSILRIILLLFRALFQNRSRLALENLALRQQLPILRSVGSSVTEVTEGGPWSLILGSSSWGSPSWRVASLSTSAVPGGICLDIDVLRGPLIAGQEDAGHTYKEELLRAFMWFVGLLCDVTLADASQSWRGLV